MHHIRELHYTFPQLGGATTLLQLQFCEVPGLREGSEGLHLLSQRKWHCYVLARAVGESPRAFVSTTRKVIASKCEAQNLNGEILLGKYQVVSRITSTRYR